LSQTFNLTVTAQSCNYFVDPLSKNVTADGGGVLVLISTGKSCSWAAASNVSWITVSGSSSGTGSGAVQLQVAQNPEGAARTGTIAIAGQTFVVNQDAAQLNGPRITDGIANAASWVSATSGIARGAYIAIMGSGLGPTQPATSPGYPIPVSLGDGAVSVNIVQSNAKAQAYLKFVSSSQINAILPSTLAAGAADISVTYNGVTGSPVRVQIVDSSFGIFYRTDGNNAAGIVQNVASATDYPLNMAGTPAKPGQIIVIWGTGLGPISTADNVAPPGGDLTTAVEITIGGKPAVRTYSGRAPGFAGVDNIYAVLPADVSLGCYVPLVVKVGGVASNTVMIAISADGKPCQ
jgi:uncharacterized protein (TIGR03437 family)